MIKILLSVQLLIILVLTTSMPGIKLVKPVFASALTVTRINDSGPGSLRQAVANALSGDTIKFAPSLAGQTIKLASTISIQKRITIDGTGLNPRIEISGGNNVRIFFVDTSATITPAIKNIVLKEGKQTAFSYSSFDGAIFVDNSATLTIENMRVTSSTAYSGGSLNTLMPIAIRKVQSSYKDD